ncbi:MAG: glutamine--tRNA ligase/YqeY domain fusion protein [Spirochaetales bacterium]
MSEVNSASGERGLDFIRQWIESDNENGRFGGWVQTRFPPEPNGYLHIGHAKAFNLDFSVAGEYGGYCSLRFDDTNPDRENVEYVDAIKDDVKWLGFDWGEHEYFASDYFEKLYELAEQLIRKGLAYVDELTPDQIREYRGTPTEPGKNSPYRDRPVEENLDLFRRMRAGEFAEGSCVLRAKIDMAHSNINMRDPTMYRIRFAHHHRTGDKWCIYPTYDWAHGQSDSIEGVTYSLCTIEFENHRPLYDWFLDALEIHHPQQIEFAPLNLTYTVMSKRKLRELVEGGYVDGWDDPRMPTLCGLRRRGYTPSAIREFLRRIGISKTESTIDLSLLEYCLREELNKTAYRVMVVLDPLKVVIENYPEDVVEQLEAINNPEDASAGTRTLPFSRELYIERGDFMEDPPKKFFRLAPGREVRLKHAYYITCNEVIRDDSGGIVELRCSYDPESRGGDTPDKRKVKGTLHWISAAHALPTEVRVYDNMFSVIDPTAIDEEAGGHWLDNFNHDSLVTYHHAKAEPGLSNAAPGSRFQFLRHGYYCVDSVDSAPGAPVFNRTVALKDTWAKLEQKGKTG